MLLGMALEQKYKMNVGLLRAGDAADFILVEDLIDFKVVKTFIGGELVAENGKSFINCPKSGIINQFNCNEQTPVDFSIKYNH